MQKYDFIGMEHEILSFWQKEKIFQRLREKNQGGSAFRFLDGPITANNPMGVHHTWGRSLKDCILRYHAMNGFSCQYRNGFDSQGLWVEVEVEKELGFRGKRDIEAYGLERFTKACEGRIGRFSKVITEQSIRLGQWMDWENSYFTHTDENISAIWHFLKICHENGWIEKTSHPMPWCPRCGTSLSEHEMAGSHQEITHTSVYARLPVKGRDFEIAVWTTTPWTLCANTALAVNPDMEYVIVQAQGFPKPLVMASTAVERVLGREKPTCLGKMLGSELTGLEYETFFPELSEQQFPHTIISWDEVADDEGSGIVHIAPGCGQEDYLLGMAQKSPLPILCPVDEAGKILSEYGFLAGKSTEEAAPAVFKSLKEHGKLIRTKPYQHAYPVCWRCKTEVLFRLVDAWVIKTDEIRPKLLNAIKTVQWEPAYAEKRMADWLTNMGDWNISRKRYYGLPLPFYPCPHCGHLTVIGSKEELLEYGDVPELHRPWIDGIKIRCPECGELVSRIPEVGDVWLDAGITPFSTMGYFTDRDEWEKRFPVEWIVEMREQLRLWFYSLLFISVTLTGRAPYEQVQCYGIVTAEDGSKFSKTGNMIRFDDAAEKTGADAIRYLFLGANPSTDVRFGYHLGEEARRKLLGLWNTAVFFQTYGDLEKPDISQIDSDDLTDCWLKNRIAAFVRDAHNGYEKYRIYEVIKAFESCIDNVSNWYIKINRRRFWENDNRAFSALYHGIKTILRVMAPVIPFLTEELWQKLIRPLEPEEVLSVHLSSFPQENPVDQQILIDGSLASKVVSLGLGLRNQYQIKVRQPLSRAAISCHADQLEAIKAYESVIAGLLNVKEIACQAADSPEPLVQLDTELTPELLREGVYRDLLRQCQVFRRECGFRVNERIKTAVVSDSPEIREAVEAYRDAVMKETLSEILSLEPENYPYQKEMKINGASVRLEMEAIR